MTTTEGNLVPATEQIVLDRSDWARAKVVDAVDMAALKLMHRWHPDQEPRSIWKAVLDAVSVAAIAQEIVGGWTEGKGSEAVFGEMRRDCATLAEAVSLWQEDKSLRLLEAFENDARAVCCLAVVEAVGENEIRFTVEARAPHTNREAFGFNPVIPEQLWGATEEGSLKVMQSWNKKGDRLTVTALRSPDGGTVIQALLVGLLPLATFSASL